MESDAAVAARVADAAGRALLEIRSASGLEDPAALRREGDRRSHELVVRLLSEARPHDAVLSEEGGADDPARLASERVWIVDPLDGTREFSEGRADFAVHVALAVDGVASVGALALPAQGLVLRSDAAPVPGARRHGVVRLVVSRSRPPAEAGEVAAVLGATITAMGSAGAKVAAVLAGEADVYLHSGGQYEWDSAAPVAVARAAGLHTSRLDGSDLRYNRPDPWLPDLLVCRAEVAAEVLRVLG